MCNLKKKNGTNQPIYKTDRDSQTQKRNLLLPEGRSRGADSKGIWEHGHTAIFEMDQQGPTVEHI